MELISRMKGKDFPKRRNQITLFKSYESNNKAVRGWLRATSPLFRRHSRCDGGHSTIKGLDSVATGIGSSSKAFTNDQLEASPNGRSR